MNESPTYHDLHITTARLGRKSIFNLPYGYEVSCTRVSGWCLWLHHDETPPRTEKIAGEYDGPGQWLILDVAGHVIVDSRKVAK